MDGHALARKLMKQGSARDHVVSEEVLALMKSVRRLYESIETIKNIFPTTDILFPLKPTMSMSLRLMSVPGILMRRKVEEKTQFVFDPGLIKTRATEKFSTCKGMISAS